MVWAEIHPSAFEEARRTIPTGNIFPFMFLNPGVTHSAPPSDPPSFS